MKKTVEKFKETCYNRDEEEQIMELKNMTEIYRKKDKVFYRDGNKLIKLFEGNYPKENILNEALNQARVERTALHIPRIEAVTSIEGKWAIVMEYIEGETLAALMKKNPSKEEEYLGTLAELQTEISAQRVPLLPRLKDKMYEKISASEYSDTVKYDLQTRLDGLPKHYKLCHGDFIPSNIIIKENGDYAIIDWSHATVGNASGDVANTFLIFSMTGKTELAEKYVDLYCEKTGTDKKEIQRWIPIVAAVRKTYNKPEEQEFLNNWINIVDFQ